jgi:hypothetical protein
LWHLSGVSATEYLDAEGVEALALDRVLELAEAERGRRLKITYENFVAVVREGVSKAFGG